MFDILFKSIFSFVFQSAQVKSLNLQNLFYFIQVFKNIQNIFKFMSHINEKSISSLGGATLLTLVSNVHLILFVYF